MLPPNLSPRLDGPRPTSRVFVPFAFFYMKQPLRLDFPWAALCLVGAVYFMFRGHVVA